MPASGARVPGTPLPVSRASQPEALPVLRRSSYPPFLTRCVPAHAREPAGTHAGKVLREPGSAGAVHVAEGHLLRPPVPLAKIR